jgi:secondary thiamine-phosphate synthase enzyme
MTMESGHTDPRRSSTWTSRAYRPQATFDCPALESTKVKSHRKVIEVNIPSRMAFLNITPQVNAALKESGIREGLALINAMHITASVFINDDEPGLHEDYARWLEQLAPFDPSPERYHHNRTGKENGDAHHKRQVMGREVIAALRPGRANERNGEV